MSFTRYSAECCVFKLSNWHYFNQGTTEEINALIQWWSTNESLFTGKRTSSKSGWEWVLFFNAWNIAYIFIHTCMNNFLSWQYVVFGLFVCPQRVCGLFSHPCICQTDKEKMGQPESQIQGILALSLLRITAEMLPAIVFRETTWGLLCQPIYDSSQTTGIYLDASLLCITLLYINL